MSGHTNEKGYHTLDKLLLPNGNYADVLVWHKLEVID